MLIGVLKSIKIILISATADSRKPEWLPRVYQVIFGWHRSRYL